MDAGTSVIGLLAAATKIHTTLLPVIPSHAICTVVRDFKDGLSPLQPYIGGSLPTASIVDVGQLIWVLGGCVVTLSRLEKRVDRITGRGVTTDEVGRAMAEDDIPRLTEILRMYTLSFNLLLGVWASGSAVDAVERTRPLEDLLSRMQAGQSWEQATQEQPNATAETSETDLAPAATRVRHSFHRPLSGSASWLSRTPSNRSAVSFSAIRRHSSVLSRRSISSRMSSATTAVEHQEPPVQSSGPTPPAPPNIRNIPLGIRLDSLYNPWWYTTRHGPRPNRARSLLTLVTGFKSATAGLLAGAATGDTLLVLRMLTIGADIEAKNIQGQTALSCACSGDHQAVVQVLLNEGADTDTVNSHYQKPLCNAAMQGNEAIVQLFLNRGMANTAAGGDALRAAASRGRLSVVALLLDHGVDANQKNSLGETALHKASGGRQRAVVELLLHRGAAIDITDKDLCTPLHCGILACDQMVVETLINFGANANATSTLYGTPLICAAKCRSERMVELLLHGGADIEATNQFHQTALTIAASRGHGRIVTQLLNYGADIESTQFNEGTPLCVAAHCGRVNMVELLLDHGAEINTPCETHQTPLGIAATRGHMLVVRLLLGRGADLESDNGFFGTPLRAAATAGHSEIVELLKRRGARGEWPITRRRVSVAWS